MPAPTHSFTAIAAVYFILAGAPLAVAAVGHEAAGRGFWIEFAVGLGFVGFAMLGLQFALTAKFQRLSTFLGLDALLHFHRQAGLIAYGFILLHIGILIAASPDYAAFLDLRVDPVRALALWAAVGALTALVATTLWRKRLGIAYDWWRLGHAVLAALVLLIGIAHILRVGWYVDDVWKQTTWLGTTLAAAGLVAYARGWKPLVLRRRPWRVTAIHPERGQAWTLDLEPVGHDGMSFQAGQFAWLTLGESPFALAQHPFSLSSSATRRNPVSLTIKAMGDYTSTIHRVDPGAPAYLDGPYGSFVLDDEADGMVLVAGGVGITPIISIVRTLRDEGRCIPTLLVYGFASEDEALFLDELAAMGAGPDFCFVPVVEHPDDGQEGETGRVGAQLLDRHLPEDREGMRYFVCGPEPMMDVVEAHLRARGIPLERILSERFNLA